MTEEQNLLDEIAKARNVEPDQEQPVKKKDPQLARKILVVAIMVSIYGAIMAGLFISKNLIFLLLVLLYVVLCKPMVKLLQKIFKITPKSDIK